MKKLMVVLGIAFLMAGCDLMGGGSDSTETSSAVTSESTIESQSSSEVSQSSVSSDSSINESMTSSDSSTTDTTKGEGAGAGGNIQNPKNDSSETAPIENDITLVPQKSDIENGFTLESDPVLQEIEARIQGADSVGIPNDVAIHFTGMYLGEAGKTQAIFILVNLTKIAMTNIELTVSFSNTSGDVILDKAPFSLSEDKFGILEPNTAMPIYLDIPVEAEDTFYNLQDFNEMVYSIDSFDYEER